MKTIILIIRTLCLIIISIALITIAINCDKTIKKLETIPNNYDVNHDGKVDSLDLLLVQKYLLEH